MQRMGHPAGLFGRRRRRRGNAALGTSPSSRPALAGWDCRRPRAAAWRLTGRPAHCAPRTVPGLFGFRGPLTDARGPACLRTASEARRLLVAEGWTDVPSWERVVQGARPADRPDGIAEPGAVRRAHGDLFFHVLLPSLLPSHRALLRSLPSQGRSACRCMAPSHPKRLPHLAHR